MNTKFKYGNVLEAIEHLRKNGYPEDFIVGKDVLKVKDLEFPADSLRIEVTFRYEGATNPGEEASVYGISTDTGIKGILILTDGVYAQSAPSSELLKKLHVAKMQHFKSGG